MAEKKDSKDRSVFVGSMHLFLYSALVQQFFISICFGTFTQPTRTSIYSRPRSFSPSEIQKFKIHCNKVGLEAVLYAKYHSGAFDILIASLCNYIIKILYFSSNMKDAGVFFLGILIMIR